MKQTDHSFCVLAYHDSPFIEECIQSLRNQTIASDILVSTSTPSVFLENLSNKYRIKLIVNSNAKGISSDWTFAYGSTETEFITLAHQDDIYLPNYTQLCLDEIQSSPGSLIAFSDYRELQGNTIKRMNLNILIKMVMLRLFFAFKNDIRNIGVKRRMLSVGNPISCPGVMYNKRNIGSLAFNIDLEINQDWDAWLYLAGKEGSFVYIKKSLFLHRIHEHAESMIGIGDDRRLKEDRLMFEKMWPEFMNKFINVFYSFSRKRW